MHFGTDGIRGVFGHGISCDLAFRVGRGAAAALGKGKILLAMDTRTSSRELANAASLGLVSGGADVIFLGVLPSPAVSYLVRHLNANGGLMITASHNPPEYNGIKVFGKNGLKATEDEEEKIDHYLSTPPPKTAKGKTELLDGSSIYLEQLTSASGDLDGLKVVCDCGYGATYKLAAEFFRASGAQLTVLNDAPNGTRINEGCGALYPEPLIPYTNGKKAYHDIGFSFDGDGDRLSVIKNGAIISGDSVLYNLSNIQNANAVVGTVLTNSALEQRLSSENKLLLRTPVGDKHILRLMYTNGYTLGGEQSGHYIIHPHGVTADGLLAAGLLAKHLASGNPLEQLELVPQRSISRFASGGRLECSDIKSLIKSSEKLLIGNGRLIVRMSGTEPKVRIMVESTNPVLIEEILNHFDEIL